MRRGQRGFEYAASIKGRVVTHVVQISPQLKRKSSSMSSQLMLNITTTANPSLQCPLIIESSRSTTPVYSPAPSRPFPAPL